MAMGCLGFAAAICGGDLIIKDYVKENVAERSRKNLVGNKVILTKYFNKGAMLGAMADNPELLKGMTIFGVGSLAGAWMMVAGKRGHSLQKLGLSMMLGGAGCKVRCQDLHWHQQESVQHHQGSLLHNHILFYMHILSQSEMLLLIQDLPEDL